jgi:hypothetical protein
MSKCEYCGKDFLFPFVCSYCGKTFCNEHRLPEKHQCPSLPKEPLFWYQKKTISDRQFLRDLMRTGETCPKCCSPFVSVWSFNTEKVKYECNICRHKWSKPRGFKFYSKGETRKDLQKETKEGKKSKKRRWFFSKNK